MTKEYYLDLIEKEVQQHEAELFNIKEAYALAHNPYKEGDIISSDECTIRIESISIATPNDAMPCCIYFGEVLNSNGKKDTIWQTKVHTK